MCHSLYIAACLMVMRSGVYSLPKVSQDQLELLQS